jgi:hypothetical protein
VKNWAKRLLAVGALLLLPVAFSILGLLFGFAIWVLVARLFCEVITVKWKTFSS